MIGPVTDGSRGVFSAAGKKNPPRSAEASPPICPPLREESEKREGGESEELAEDGDGTRTQEKGAFARAHKFGLLHCLLV